MPHIQFTGPCCACGSDREKLVDAAIVPLALPEKLRGEKLGWGCVACGLAEDGAMAAVCRDCASLRAPLTWAICGGITAAARIPLTELRTRHQHNPADHPEVPPSRTCRACGCSEHFACWDHAAGTCCYWAEEDLCSACAQAARLADSLGSQSIL